MSANENKEEIENALEENITFDEIIEEAKKEEVKEEKFENKYIKRKSKKVIILICVLILLVIIGVISTFFAIFNIGNTKIMNGVSIKGIDIGSFSKEQAEKKLEEILKLEIEKDIKLIYSDFEITINPVQIEFKYKIKDAIEKAYRIGRDGNILHNNYAILKTLIFKDNIDLEFTYNDEILNDIIEDIQTKLPGALKNYTYYIEDENLIITPGTEGVVIQKERIKTLILEKVQESINSDKKINIPVQTGKPSPIDIEKIYSEIYTEPKDAYYTKDPFVVYPEVYGVDFEISLEEAKEMLKEQKESYSIKLKYTKPDFTKDNIGTEAFPDLLSSFSTKYDVTNRNRSNNLKLASDKINGTVVMPEEEFSYNKVVGERTIAAGYKEAKIYSNGKVIDGLGGGICQISSTLYNSVVYANLEIVSRRNHQFVTSYLKAGLDATVVYGSQDFIFKNSRKFPIKIVSEVKNGVAKIDIFGVREESEYDIEIEPIVINYIPFTTKYITDETLEPGTEVVDQKGANGVKTVTYKYLKLNGSIISKTTLSTDTYNPMQKIVRVGPEY